MEATADVNLVANPNPKTEAAHSPDHCGQNPLSKIFGAVVDFGGAVTSGKTFAAGDRLRHPFGAVVGRAFGSHW